MAIQDIDNTLVTTGKPVDGGCMYTNFSDDASLPTDATTKMSTLTGWESLGEISDQGLTISKSATSNKFKGWHGTVVLAEISDEEHTLKVEFIEPNRPAVAKLRHGTTNVEEGDDGSVSHIQGIVGTGTSIPIVVDELESNGYLRRTVIPKATVDTFDDEPHQRGALLVYGMTLTMIDKGDGKLFDIYRAKPTTDTETV